MGEQLPCMVSLHSGFKFEFIRNKADYYGGAIYKSRTLGLEMVPPVSFIIMAPTSFHKKMEI